MYDKYPKHVVEAVAESLRNLEIDGQKVFKNVYTEEVDSQIWVDLAGVEGTLYFELTDYITDPAIPVPPAPLPAPYGRSVIERLMEQEAHTVDSSLATPPPVPVPTGHTYGIERKRWPGQVHQWKTITSLGVAGEIVDSQVGPDNVREITDIKLHSASVVPAEQVIDPSLLRLEVNGRSVPPDASIQWLVSNGFLPIDYTPEG